MNEKVEFIKSKIIELAAGNNISKIEEYNWGKHERTPDKKGILLLEDGWYIYSNTDHMESIFTGPISDEEIIGYLCAAEFDIEAGEYAIDRRRMYEIMFKKTNGFDSVQANIKKKLYEMKKEIIEQKMNDNTDTLTPNV